MAAIAEKRRATIVCGTLASPGPSDGTLRLGPGGGAIVPQRFRTIASTLDAQCSSGACLRDSGTCGKPRATGEPCSVDAGCVTANCSTDGVETTVGHCNEELGTTCSASAAGHNVTATCNDCLVAVGATTGVCLRSDCDPVDAGHCATFAGHEFQCAESTDRMYRCHEVCADEFDDCFDSTAFCGGNGDFCG